jgi:ABC-type uncharacterized transport system substrate-binding protein
MGHKYASVVLAFLLLLDAVSCGAFTAVVLKSKDLAPYDLALEGFKTELQGQEMRLVEVDAAGREGAEIILHILAERPRFILCLGTEAFELASSIRDVPKIFCLVPFSRAERLISKGNARGVVIDIPSAIQFKILCRALPKIRRIGVMYDPQSSGKIIAKALQDAAKLHLELIAQPVQSIREVPLALGHLNDKIDVLWSIFDSTAYGSETARYALFQTLKRNIPFVGFSPQFVKAGALMAVYGDYKDMGCQAAALAGNTLDNVKLPEAIIEPRSVHIAINRKVSEAMKIQFSSEFLQTVNESF